MLLFCSEADVDTVHQVYFRLPYHHTEEDGEQSWREDASLLYTICDGETAREDAVVLDLAHLTFVQLAENAEELWRAAKTCQDLP